MISYFDQKTGLCDFFINQHTNQALPVHIFLELTHNNL